MIDVFALFFYAISAIWIIRIILNALMGGSIKTSIAFLSLTTLSIVALYVSAVYLDGLAVPFSIIILLMMGAAALQGPVILYEYSKIQRLLSSLIVLSIMFLSWLFMYLLVSRI